MKLQKKRKKKTRLVKYFTKPLLQEAARNAEKWDFNRQLDLDAINTRPHARFPVIFTLLHEHRHGVPAEPHMRARVVIDAQGDTVVVDMPLEFWNALPQARVAA